MPSITRRAVLHGAAAAPALAQADSGPLNLIHIGVDTWGTHHLGAYGHTDFYKTPHVDKLLAQSAIFTDAYPQALPTIPSRRCLYTGRQIFPSIKVAQPDDQVKIRGWHQLYAEDVTLSETLYNAGYTTGFVSDLYHQFKPGKNFTRGFDMWRFIRGQETDRWRTGPRAGIDLAKYAHPSQAAGFRNTKRAAGVFQYLLNRRDWKTDDDWLAAQVFDNAASWLRDNAGENQPFYLHIESFSPHEYWDPPEEWHRLYLKKDYRGPRLIHPPLTTKDMSPLEVEHAVALYAGLVSFVDTRIGRFLREVESLGLARNTVIVFVADHGTMMGEQGQLHKGENRLRVQCTNVPFAIRHPREKWGGKKVKGYVSHMDLMPTVLDLLGVAAPKRVTGENLRAGIASGRVGSREWILTGWGEHASIRTPEWNYVARWSEGPKFEELYDLAKDPLELTNVAASKPSVCADFRKRLAEYVAAGWSVTKGTFHQEIS